MVDLRSDTHVMLDELTDPRLRGVAKICMTEIPGFRIRFKDKSKWMKLLNIFARLFNKDFMSRYTTTTGRTVYFPTKEKLLSRQGTYAQVLAHELVHLVEREKEGMVQNFLRYAFPQVLAVFALLAIGAIWNSWFLLALLFLLALAPLPAPGRRDIELRGYSMSMAVAFWTTGHITDRDFEFYARQFTSSAYYFMWPFKKGIMHRLKMKAQDIRTGSILRDPLFRKIHDAFMVVRS